MDKLSELIVEADWHKEQGLYSSKLARALRLEANQVYEQNVANKEFQQILALAQSIDELKAKVKWEERYTIVGKGSLEQPAVVGSFTLDHYAGGLVDLLKNGAVINRIYGLRFLATPQLQKFEDYAIWLFHPAGKPQYKRRRMNSLFGKLDQELPSKKSEQRKLGWARDDFDNESTCTDTVETDAFLDFFNADKLRESVTQAYEDLASEIGAGLFKIHCVGRVNGGEHRKRK